MKKFIAIALVVQCIFMGILMTSMHRVTQVTEEIKIDIKSLDDRVQKVENIVLYQTKEKLTVSSKEFDCLARNIYHEAGIEKYAGKVAVAQVTLNRLKSGRWGNDICSVVHSKAQFSWTLSKRKRNETPKGKLWNDSLLVANEFVRNGERVRGLEGSHFYHTDYIKSPKWADKRNKIFAVGQHIFYTTDKKKVV